MTPKSAIFALRARLACRLGRRVRLWLALYAVLVLALFGTVVLALNLGRHRYAAGASLQALAWGALALFSGGAGLCLLVRVAQPLPGPPGIRVSPGRAPELDAVLERIAHRLGCGRVDAVWITPDMNAALLQRPAWGSLGPIRSHLLLGLPLLLSVSVEQLEAILAHEFAHLARQRSGRDAVDACLRALCVRVLDPMCGCLPAGLERALDRFCLDMLRLSRLEEFEADALAASLVGAEQMGATLLEVGRKARFLELDYWPAVQAHNRRSPWRARHPYREMGQRIETALLHAALSAPPLHEEAPDLHPDLRQRLRLLQVSPAATPMPMPAPSAARHYFPALLPDVAWVFDMLWCAAARAERRQKRRTPVCMRRVKTADIMAAGGYRR